MAIVKSIADFFRKSFNPESRNKVDRFGVLSPLMATIEYAEVVQKLLVDDKVRAQYGDLLVGKTDPKNPAQSKAVQAYKAFVQALPSSERNHEATLPFYTMSVAIGHIITNLGIIEDNFMDLFGDMVGEETEESVIRTSSLVVLGYIETANEFLTWMGQLTAHASQTDELIPPFWTKALIDNAHKMGEFVGNNLSLWNPKSNGLLKAVTQLHKKGADVAVRTGDHWIDEFVHDQQFTFSEQNLMTASIRGPILMLTDRNLAGYQKKIELYNSRREWLISKIALEEARLAGMDPASPEYKKMRKATDHYAGLVTKYEQKLERMR